MEHLSEPNKYKYNRIAVFQFIVAYKRSHDGNSPSLRDIMAEFSISSVSEANHIVLDLIEMGMIHRPLVRRGRAVARGIEVVGGAWSFHAQVRVR
jgi:hypothetical protein